MGAQKNRRIYDGSLEYPQHMFWLRNKKKNKFQLHTRIWGLVYINHSLWIDNMYLVRVQLIHNLIETIYSKFNAFDLLGNKG